MEEWTFALDALPETAARFNSKMDEKKIIAFRGEMGAGKTTFIHALCDDLQVSSKVSSPTFSIINEYGFPGGSLYHIDLYRLRDEAEAVNAGVEDCIYSNNICFIEWPERAPGLLPPDTLHVYLEALETGLRRIRVETD